MNKTKKAIAYALSLDTVTPILMTGSGIAWVVAFFIILPTGGYLAMEPNKPLLWVEITIALIIALLGIRAVIKRLKGDKM
jgi:hypothetical protein